MALSTNCWKYLVLTFNVLYAMSAVVLFGASGFLLYKLFIYRHFIGISAEYPAILLLMLAIISCSIAWIGWRTAKSMYQIHVIITGILITLVVIVEFSCFVWAMVVWDTVEIDIKSTILQYFEQTIASTESMSVDTIRWDRLQVRFECCGVSGPSDYTSKGQVPFSCCGQGPLDSIHKPYTAQCTMLYQRGCGKQLHDYAREQLMYVAITALIASVLQDRGENNLEHCAPLHSRLDAARRRCWCDVSVGAVRIAQRPWNSNTNETDSKLENSSRRRFLDFSIPFALPPMLRGTRKIKF